MKTAFNAYRASANTVLRLKLHKIRKELQDPNLDETKINEMVRDMYKTHGATGLYCNEKYDPIEKILDWSNTIVALKCTLRYVDDSPYLFNYLRGRILKLLSDPIFDIDLFNFMADNLLKCAKYIIKYTNDYDHPTIVIPGFDLCEICEFNFTGERCDAIELLVQKYYDLTKKYTKKMLSKHFLNIYEKILNGEEYDDKGSNCDKEYSDGTLMSNYKNLCDDNKEVDEEIIDICVRKYKNTKCRKNIVRLLKTFHVKKTLSDIKEIATSMTKSATHE